MVKNVAWVSLSLKAGSATRRPGPEDGPQRATPPGAPSLVQSPPTPDPDWPQISQPKATGAFGRSGSSGPRMLGSPLTLRGKGGRAGRPSWVRRGGERGGPEVVSLQVKREKRRLDIMLLATT